MSSISREELIGVIRGVIEFTENRGVYEDTEQWVPKLILRDGVISKMQLCVLLEKLKAWCV